MGERGRVGRSIPGMHSTAELMPYPPVRGVEEGPLLFTD